MRRLYGTHLPRRTQGPKKSCYSAWQVCSWRARGFGAFTRPSEGKFLHRHPIFQVMLLTGLRLLQTPLPPNEFLMFGFVFWIWGFELQVLQRHLFCFYFVSFDNWNSNWISNFKFKLKFFLMKFVQRLQGASFVWLSDFMCQFPGLFASCSKGKSKTRTNRNLIEMFLKVLDLLLFCFFLNEGFVTSVEVQCSFYKTIMFSMLSKYSSVNLCLLPQHPGLLRWVQNNWNRDLD